MTIVAVLAAVGAIIIFLALILNRKKNKQNIENTNTKPDGYDIMTIQVIIIKRRKHGYY